MKIKEIKVQDGIDAKKHRKEDKFQEQITGVVIIDGELIEAVTLRVYGTNSKNYACLWYHDNKGNYGNGSGSAGGYGYHRPSEAAYEAFIAGGINIEHFGGRGDSATKNAVKLLTKKMYPRRKVHLMIAHG